MGAERTKQAAILDQKWTCQHEVRTISGDVEMGKDTDRQVQRNTWTHIQHCPCPISIDDLESVSSSTALGS